LKKFPDNIENGMCFSYIVTMYKILLILFLVHWPDILGGLSLSWPTGTSPLGKSALRTIDDCIQPTESGKLESGKFGLVRENGKRFHEGIDIKSFIKAKGGDPADGVYAFTNGVVVYVNTNPGASSYGRYIVIEHECFLTLYAHLAAVDVTVGQAIKAGGKIGILGTSSNCANIPNSRAHVHFEIDFQVSDDENFASWYAKNFCDKNIHGAYNGFNLIGIDPISSIEKLVKGVRPTDILREEKDAATIQIVGNYVPGFVKKYAKFFACDVDLSKPVRGWRVQFSWVGLPMRWEPIYSELALVPRVKLVSYRKSLLERALLRDVLKRSNLSGGRVEITVGLRAINVFKKMGFDFD
jgi:murein DD-endopeptidase MepM/ murein hydrolase activator NlpD